MEKILYLNLSEKDLQFVGEGNEHIVFGISNSDAVLRFRKFCLGEEAVNNRDDFVRQVTEDWRFVNDVARPLAGALLIDEAHLIAVDPKLLENTMNAIQELRSEKRLIKTVNPYGIGILTANVATAFIPRTENKNSRKVHILSLDQKKDNFCSLSSNQISIDAKSNTYEISSPILSQLPDHILLLNQAATTSISTNIQDLKTESQSSSSENPHLVVRKSEDFNLVTESHFEEIDENFSIINRQKNKDSHEISNDQNLDNELPTIGNLMDEAGCNESLEIGRLICVELKPKQGYLEPSFSGRRALCRFCIKQYVKLETNVESSLSGYCPQHLFSGEQPLMSRALENLFEAPQNNLKIFSNGKRVENYDDYEYLTGILLEILTSQLYSSDESQNLTSESHSTISSNIEQKPELFPILPTLRSHLSKNSILGRVLSSQYLGRLSEMTNAIVYKEFIRRNVDDKSTELSNFEFLTRSETDWKLTRNNIEGKLDESLLSESHLSSSSSSSTSSSWDANIELLDTDTLVQLLQEALVAMSFKDISIMILIQGPYKNRPIEKTTNHTSPFWIQDPNQKQHYYKCQVTLVDLALKSASKILDHELALKKLEDILMNLELKDEAPSCCKY